MSYRELRADDNEPPAIRVDVLDDGARARRGRTACSIDHELKFTTKHLESYCLAPWEPIIYDSMLVAAAIEFCDRIGHRRVHRWSRSIELRVPVHDPDRWTAKPVLDALHEALTFLTGDLWTVSFVARCEPFETPRQFPLPIPGAIEAVIPFSEGLDSRAVAGLMERELGDQLIRVRLGTKPFDASEAQGAKQLFTSIPYKVEHGNERFVEPSVRSRGFKFAMVSGLAALLVQANRIIVTESGQGALGPALVPVGQTYPDYRNHPLFTKRMEAFFMALYGRRITFAFPRLWHTKGETLKAFVSECSDGSSWQQTWSCWQRTHDVSVDHHKRQCGICAACMLRRMSIHAAGLTEDHSAYVWENLSAATFEKGVPSTFERVTGAQHKNAIAGTLHLKHLAALQHDPLSQSAMNLAISQLSRALELPKDTVSAKLHRLLARHESEWNAFVASLGPSSFVANWAVPS